jgi:hypothetical protein
MPNVYIDSTANIDRVRLKEQLSAPTTPDSGYGYLYIKSDGLYFKGDNGTEIGPFTVGGTGGAAILEVQVFS